MITANDVKIKGINCFEKALENQPEAVITVRGQERYVVMKVEQYHHFREIELAAALREVKHDLTEGKITHATIDEHVEEIFGQ